MPGNIEALVRYNASRCEAARGKRCECHCGGALHGAAHSEQWVRETAALMAERAAARSPDPLGGFLLADTTKFCGPCDSYVKPLFIGAAACCPMCSRVLT